MFFIAPYSVRDAHTLAAREYYRDTTMVATPRHLVLLLLPLLLQLDIGTTTATDEDGLKFLEENRGKEGVMELPSGLQYKVLHNGTGTFHPQPSCQCLVHYTGKLIDGHVFDSSYDRGEPLRVSPGQVIDGWKEAMQRMVAGDRWGLFVPPELGYGGSGHVPDIPPHAVLLFSMEMVAVDCEQRTPALRCNVATKELCNAREVSFIEKSQAWTMEKVVHELDRLRKILAEDAHLKEDLKEWVIRREFILQHSYSDRTVSSNVDEL